MSGTAADLPPEQALLPRRPAQGRSLLVVLGVVAALAALALLFSRGADRLDTQWTAQLDRTSTVQILVPSEPLRDTQMREAEDILRAALPDATLTPLTREDSRALLRPWLGETALPDDLPVPGIITVAQRAALPTDTLARQFEQAGLRASIDDHARFSSGLRRTVGRLVGLGTALVALTLVAATAVSGFATRAGLAAQRDIIHVLVQAGASDRFIARLFTRQAVHFGGLGGLAGVGLAVLVWIYVSLGPGRGSVGWNGPGAVLSDLVWLAVLVGAFALICALAASTAALRQLSDERRRA